MTLAQLKKLTQDKLLKIYNINESGSIFHLLLDEFLGIDTINYHINIAKKYHQIHWTYLIRKFLL